MAKKVFLGMSGGVDSSVSAHLLIQAGYEVEGITMLLREASESRERELSSARDAADKLGIKLHVCDFSERFSALVTDYFCKEYTLGRTPNPCIVCNPRVKFGLMLDYALGNGADYIATGHYAGVEFDAASNKYILVRNPSKKDQSYFLNRLTQQKLAHTVFPLSKLSKDEVREKAKTLGLVSANKPDSQEICFIPDGDYASYICSHTSHTPRPGSFCDAQGNILGQHRGLIYYTVGQRKGLGGTFGEPMYVTALNAQTNSVILGRAEQRYSNSLTASDFNWISGEAPAAEFTAAVKIRSTSAPAPARVMPDGDRVRIVFDSPALAVTPGQSAVIYDGDRVLGGGFID